MNNRIFCNHAEIILASGSPRRRAFLQDLGLVFKVFPSSIEEKRNHSEDAVEYVERLAREKAEYAAALYPAQWILAADTIVCLDELILEKPQDDMDALHMLMMLRGREHIVRTAVCLVCKNSGVMELRTVATIVRFWQYTEEMARSYVATGEPMDKAGSYGIQGQGSFLVKGINGSYSNVVGLPLAESIEMLIRNDVISGSCGR